MESSKKTKAGSVFGGILLVSGCCIGAGMLGLPVLTAAAGFKPSVFMFIAGWLFMLSTGLLLLEVNLWFNEEVNIVSMAEKTLGFLGKAIAWVVFLFLFYSLMVAYVTGSGELFSDFIAENMGISLPVWIGSLIMILFFGAMIYLGTLAVDQFNRLLMLGLIISYILLVMMGSSHVNPKYFHHIDWKASLFTFPVLMISFGYHNLVPSLTNYLERDAKRLRITLIVGSAIPLLIYLVWEWLILGLIPLEGKGGFMEALDNGEMATRALKIAVGSSWIVDLAQYFAFFAIVTSFLGVALSLVDFLADGLKIKKTPTGKLKLCILAMLPPFLFSIFYPKIFLTALNFAGGFGAVVIFGILPAAMVWAGRYGQNIGAKPIIPGGKGALLAVILFACAVIALQLYQILKG